MNSKNDDQHLDEYVITRLVNLIAQEDDFESIGAEMLRLIGKNFKADYCYVYRYTDAHCIEAVHLFNWINPESDTKFINLPPPESDAFEPYRDELLMRQTVLLSERELSLTQSEIRSRLICGIWIKNKLYGFIGADYLTDQQEFLSRRIGTMNNIANLFTVAFRQTHQAEELRDSVSLSRQIMDNLQLPILLIDLEYRVQAANPTKKIGVNQPMSEVRGSYCYNTICKCGSPPEFCSVQETLRTKMPSRKEFTFEDKRLISTSQPIFDRNGEMQYVLSVDIDITEVTRQKEALELAIKQAEAANRVKSYFLATVSHELRTPLNAVIGFSELLQESVIDEDTQKDYLRSINFAGTALLNLINDVLDISNIEANQILITPAKIDLADLLDQVAKIFTLKARQKNLTITVEASEVKHLVYVDSQRMRQIILNLIGNAIKFTNEGGITIKASFEPKTKERGTLFISVSDTGIGISPENQEKIFEPFVHDSVIRGKHIYEGSGLGLTISRRLLEKMGGSIQLESELGKGCTFKIEMDVQFDPAEQTQKNSPASKSKSNISTSGKTLRVLIVDDVSINLKVLAAMLKHLNVTSSLAESAEEALAILREDRNYDLIMTDMWMPNCNGVEMTKIIRKELKITDIPIALITADTEVSQKDQEIFEYILYKPITTESISAILPEA